MIKKIVATSLVATALILSGCGGDGSEGEERLSINLMLDTGDFDGVITTIGEKNTTTDSDNMILGAAYMGKAGIGLPDLIDIVSSSSDSNASDNAFGSFVDGIAAKTDANPNALADLENSSKYYNKVGVDCTDTNLSVSEEDVCLFTGLSQMMKAGTTLSLLTDDIGALGDPNAAADPKLKATTCAMQYANNPGSQDGNCSVTPASDVVFSESNKTYTPLNIVYTDASAATHPFDFLLTTGVLSSTAITKGYCNLATFDSRVQETNASTYDMSTFYVCPVDESTDVNSSLTTSSVLVDALNDGTDSIGVAATEEMQDSIDEFKCDILGGTFTASTDSTPSSCDTDITQDISEAQLIDYLNK